MATDLGLVTHATQRHAHELAVRSPGQWTGPARSCPRPEGPTRHRIGAFDLVHALLHSKVLEDAFLDLVQSVVILVENLLGVQQILA